MNLRSWHLWGAFLLLLFVGCRSEKAALAFQSTTPATEAKAIASASVLVDSVPPVAVAALRVRVAERPSVSSLSSSTGTRLNVIKPAIRQQISQVSPAKFQLKNRQSAALSHQETASRDTFHLVLGAGLIVGGVVAGLLIGGWLGFGLGALIVLLGDYFLILGIGGKHAWLEIFQEFFNL